MTHLHLDVSVGAAGDMLLAALIDAGGDIAAIRSAVATVVGDAVSLDPQPTSRAGLRAVHLEVTTEQSPPHRNWRDVQRMITGAELYPAVATRALGVFERLARAEGAVHGVAPEDVHFHEVGALDAIADIVGVTAALHDLAPESVSATTVGVGSGIARVAHGAMPVPVPAVAELLRGVPTHAGPLPFEACTPTAAAILCEVVDAWGGQPPMVVSQVGIGAGTRSVDDVANVVRAFVGRPLVEVAVPAAGTAAGLAAELAAGSNADLGPAGDRPRLIESNIDDMDPRLWPTVIEALLAAGAADAWLTPILMKKGRPAHTLSVLVAAERAAAVRRVVFEQTTSIGVRETTFDKVALQREFRTVTVLGGHEVAVKVARDPDTGEVLNTQPEWEDVRRVAQATGMPAKEVLRMCAAADADAPTPD